MIYTDGTKHDLEWFEDLYINQAVTPENYTEETNKGLYTYVSSLLINAGMQKIRFEYRDDDGNLLKGETVPVLYYGQKGEPGEQGATYKGIGHDAIGTGIRTPWVEGDTYINAADGYLYNYDSAERLWTKIPSYADSRYNQAINDMIALSNNTGYDAEFLNVINLWVRNLTAQTALINQLFAKELTLQEGGVIKSGNYQHNGNEGFMFNYNGEAVFNKDVTMKGAVINGSFYVKPPEDISAMDFKGRIVDCPAFTVLSPPFKTAEGWWVYEGMIKYLDETYNMVFEGYMIWDQEGTMEKDHRKYVPANYYIERKGWAIGFDYRSTIKMPLLPLDTELIDLPLADKPIGTLYRDSDGFIKIVTTNLY